MSPTPVIEVEGLVKTFGRTRALDGLDLEVLPGEVHGFIGPNGSGKSTTLRALLGLLRTDGGRARVLGLDPWAASVEVHRRLAYVPGDVALWPDLTGGETVDLLLRLRGLDPRASGRDELLDRFGLDPTLKGRAYSKGNRQKVALVAAFAGAADLLVLDEPTTGLDPLVEQVFDACVAERTAAGATVLLSSHVLSEVERLADRVTIIRRGRAVESGTMAALRHLRRQRVRAQLAEGVADHVAAELGVLEGVHEVRVGDGVVSCAVDPEGLAPVLAVLGRAGTRDLVCAPPTLEELFLDAYRGTGTP